MKDTRENIIDAFFRLAEKNPTLSQITIAQVAEEANISKQTIYRKHYSSTQDIISDMHRLVDEQILKELTHHPITKGTSPFKIISEVALPIVYEHRNWLKVLYNTSIDGAWMNFLTDNLNEWALLALQGAGQRVGIPQEMLCKIVIKHSTTIISEWISEELPIHPTTFSKIYLNLVQLSLNDLVSDDCKL